jgi:hypothetical protein
LNETEKGGLASNPVMIETLGNETLSNPNSLYELLDILNQNVNEPESLDELYFFQLEK